jgi:oligoribonuclease NrnB/cAMP/cGMP phosphodiesterase (DHH superfamily)
MEKSKKVVVIYHANCWDGFCAAWLFHRVYPDALFIPAQYGDPIPLAQVEGKRVFIVDFSYPLEAMKEIALATISLTVLDHHKTAEPILMALQQSVKRRGVTIFRLDASGGRLAWEYLKRDLDDFDKIPWLVEYTEDRDLWRHALLNSKAVNAALRSHPLDFAKWDNLDGTNPGHPDNWDKWDCFIAEGGAILRREEQIVDEAVRNAEEVFLAGHKVLAVNTTVLFSDIAGKLAKGRPFGIAWFVRKGGIYQYSLRSEEGGEDVSLIAQGLGGGGHKHAAGFENKNNVLTRIQSTEIP